VRLVVEAPALVSSLRRLFGDAQARTFAEDYEAVSVLGGNHEGHVVREPAASFNPRVARILTILIRDVEIVDVVVLRAALWSTVADPGALDRLKDDSIKALAIRVLAQDLMVDEVVAAIRAAIALDTIRHLHMTSLSSEARTEYLNSDELGQLVRENSPVPLKLKLKLRHAVAFQDRVLEHSVDQNHGQQGDVVDAE